MRKTNILIAGAALLVVVLFCVTRFIDGRLSREAPRVAIGEMAPISEIGPTRRLSARKWTRCFQGNDGTIHFSGHLQSPDGGVTAIHDGGVDVEEINSSAERAVISIGPLCYATGGAARLIRPGKYAVEVWRSRDRLRTLQREEATVEVSEGPTSAAPKGAWYGLYVYRTIIRMPDGSWLMTMYGNFKDDTITPGDDDARKETTFMMRTFIVKSTDEGRSWRYLSTVAAPRRGDPVGEGFVEPAITSLRDGRLLCVMRTGHHFPLYASWSADGGKTWTSPLYTGLDRACDPCLITLRDGRVALSWGRRYPEGWSKITSAGDQSLFKYPGEGRVNLAVSDDGGLTWTSRAVARRAGSCYTTLLEVASNVLLMQVDGWYWRITLKPRAGAAGHASLDSDDSPAVCRGEP